MVAAANLVEVAALVGDTARATMLAALMGGQSLTATELAYCANISRSTASGHRSLHPSGYGWLPLMSPRPSQAVVYVSRILKG
jgi:hypothetical protein